MYYHYTNRCGAMAIRSSGYLQPSEETGAFGPGVYLTDLHPIEFFRDEILLNNYGGIKSEFHNRADWVVEILEKNLKMQLLRKVNVPGESDRRIFVYPYFILVKPDQIYDKPRCFKSYVIDEVDTSSDDTEDDSFETGGDINCGDGLGQDENWSYVIDEVDTSSDDTEDDSFETGGDGNCSDGQDENGYDDFENEDSGDDYGEIGDEGNRSDELGIDENFDSSNEEIESDECVSDENGDGSNASGSEENGIDDLEPNQNEDDSNDGEGEENGGDGIESSEKGDGSYSSFDGNYEDGDCYYDDYCESVDDDYES